VTAHGRVRPGDWLAVHGCGGVGLSAVMIGAALGARVVAVDVCAAALARAGELGAEISVNAGEADVPAVVGEVTGGGAPGAGRDGRNRRGGDDGGQAGGVTRGAGAFRAATEFAALAPMRRRAARRLNCDQPS
jgi:threonine dehydrogenase-like Zn-dependent dehydrogenase